MDLNTDSTWPSVPDLVNYVLNAVEREGSEVPVKIEPVDFAVHRTKHSTRTSTVLMIDMSRSMFLRGCFLAAKKVAIALDSLIRSQFPHDSLYLVGFSNFAVELTPQSLPAITLNDYVYCTNMQHGFQVARSLLTKHRGNRQVIMVTDGEPSAYSDEKDHAFFSCPPSVRTKQKTLREVRLCTRGRIIINTIMLDRGLPTGAVGSPKYPTEFVNEMTSINKGRAFFVSPERMSKYVLVDYVSGRSNVSGAAWPADPAPDAESPEAERG